MKFLNISKKVWYSNIVWGDKVISNDDSASRAATKDLIQMQIDTEEIDEWPLDKAEKLRAQEGLHQKSMQ